MKNMYAKLQKMLLAFALLLGMSSNFIVNAEEASVLSEKQQEVVLELVNRGQLTVPNIDGEPDISAVTWADVEAVATVVSIASVNDIHGAVYGKGSPGASSSNPGISRFATAVRNFKTNNEHPYFLGSGDLYQGSAISNLTEGKVMNEVFKNLGMAYSAVGNHEFDWGADKLPGFQTDGGFKFLIANMIDKKTGLAPDWAEPTGMIEVDGVKIGIIGLTTPNTKYQTAAANVENYDFPEPIAITQKHEAELRADGADSVIVLSHLGSVQEAKPGYQDEGTELAEAVQTLDGVFTAHYHFGVDKEVGDAKVPVVQGFYNGRGLSKITLVFDKDKELIANYGDVEDIRAQIDSLANDPVTDAIVERFETELAPILTKKVATTLTSYPHERSDVDPVTPMGQLTAKIMSEIGGTDIAIINGGGIRAGFDAGDITMGTMYEIFPFDNTLVTMKMTGADIKSVIEHGIPPMEFRPGQFYGMNVEFYANETGAPVVSRMTLLDGTPVKMDQIYTVSTLDFLMTGGDKYNFDAATDVVDTFLPLRDQIAAWMEAEETIDFVPTTNLVKVAQPEEFVIADVFTDAQLAALVTELLGSDTATQEQLDTITRLDGPTLSGVTNLVGINKLTNLEALIFEGTTALADFSPLKDLTQLKTLHMRNSSLTDTSFVASLPTTITSLDLSHNELGDVSALATLPNLSLLILNDNFITDVSAFSNYTGAIYLDENSISDISKLTKAQFVSAEGQLIISQLTGFTTANQHTFANTVRGLDGQLVSPTAISHKGTYADGKFTFTGLTAANTPGFTFNQNGTRPIALPTDAELDEAGEHIKDVLFKGSSVNAQAAVETTAFSGLVVSVITDSTTVSPGVPVTKNPILPTTGEPIVTTLLGGFALLAASGYVVMRARKRIR